MNLKIPPNIVRWLMYAVFTAALLFPFDLTVWKHACIALLLGQLFSQLNNLKKDENPKRNWPVDEDRQGERP